MAVDNDGPVAEITLERYRLKELGADVAARLERRMQVDDHLRRRVDALARSDEQIRTSDRLELVAARVRRSSRGGSNRRSPGTDAGGTLGAAGSGGGRGRAHGPAALDDSSRLPEATSASRDSTRR